MKQSPGSPYLSFLFSSQALNDLNVSSDGYLHFVSLVPLSHDEVSLVADLPVIQHAQVSRYSSLMGKWYDGEVWIGLYIGSGRNRILTGLKLTSIIGASLSEPHTRELVVKIYRRSALLYVCMYPPRKPISTG